MITGIGIQNFRVFDEMTQIDFAPITVLTGRNNSGKSSVLKALLLLQDNAKKNNLTELDFNSSTHQLGTFQEALSKNKKRNKSDEMFFYVKTNVVDEVATHLFFGSENIILEQTYKIDENRKKGNLAHITLKNDNEKLFFDAEIKIENFKKNQSVYFNLGSSIFIRFQKMVENITQKLNGKDIFIYSDNHFLKEVQKYISSPNSSKYLLNENNLTELLGKYNQDFETLLNKALFRFFSKNLALDNAFLYRYFNFVLVPPYPSFEKHKQLFESRNNKEQYINFVINELFTKEEQKIYKTEIEQLTFTDELLDSEMVIIIHNIEVLFHNYIKDHINSLENLTFLTVARSNVQRLYLNNNQGTVFNELIYEFLKKDFSKNGEEYQFLNTALKDIFQIGEGIVFEEIAGIGTIIKIQKDGELYNLADMGFGLTALLPILLKIVLSPESLLMIEEPESNLHPNFQAKLADLFVLAQKTFGIRFILETHSEYLIRRLQILTALKEHEYHLETDETALYYFYPPDEVPRGKEQVSRIHILEDGRLDKPFGSQFLDMSDEQVMDLYDAMED